MLALQNQKAMYDFSVSNMKLNTHSRLFFTSQKAVVLAEELARNGSQNELQQSVEFRTEGLIKQRLVVFCSFDCTGWLRSY
ncbi:hypothetical protein NC653_012109 [Populus alba x Populus x berolinensis]|uniref:Uncharacterized protein n=1 Tax=Populus alba x Populus x berolinensis TaxID=444605 RepID=A0AAD6R536_9ROSI|nr:hypothetical protein NC653_012109 [Populus alba x Populus x berolinensis]